jgi:hypothetical protein
MIEIEFDNLDDDVKALLGVSPPFRFEAREPNDFYISIDVPGPCAQVDLAQAWEIAQLDARACQLTLEHDHSFEATLRVYRNNLSWLRFWSVRFPDAEWRQRFELELGARRIGLDGLRRKARATASPMLAKVHLVRVRVVEVAQSTNLDRNHQHHQPGRCLRAEIPWPNMGQTSQDENS